MVLDACYGAGIASEDWMEEETLGAGATVLVDHMELVPAASAGAAATAADMIVRMGEQRAWERSGWPLAQVAFVPCDPDTRAGDRHDD